MECTLVNWEKLTKTFATLYHRGAVKKTSGECVTTPGKWGTTQGAFHINPMQKLCQGFQNSSQVPDKWPKSHAEEYGLFPAKALQKRGWNKRDLKIHSLFEQRI